MATAPPAIPTPPTLSVQLGGETIDALAAAVAARVAALLPDPVEHRWLGAGEAAQYLALSIDALHKLPAENRIPHCQDGHGAKLYFRRSELDAWRLAGHVAARKSFLATCGDFLPISPQCN